MKPRSAIALVLVLTVSAVCARLGFWQVDRWHEKRRLNAEMRASLEAPLLELRGDPGGFAAVRGRRVSVRGRYDESRQILLSFRAHDGAPGVDVVTPLLLADGKTALLVDRGWLYASDGAAARPQDYREPGLRAAVGLPFELRHGAAGPALRTLTTDSLTLWSARWLDADTLARRLPYPLASWALRELPGPGVPERPVRSEPRPLDEMMHLSYAIQWFLFGSILLGGSAALAWSRGRRGTTPAPAGSAPAADPDLYRRG